MKEVDESLLEEIFNHSHQSVKFLFVYSTFCGTCHLARKIIEPLELTWTSQAFYEINASFNPDFLHENKIESVPCLLIVVNGTVKEKIYAFNSVTFMYQKLLPYIN